MSQLLPEQLQQRLELHLQALLRGDHVDRAELQSLVVEARQQTGQPSHRELPSIDRVRLEEEWRQVEALVQQVRQRLPWMGVHRGYREELKARRRRSRAGRRAVQPALSISRPHVALP